MIRLALFRGLKPLLPPKNRQGQGQGRGFCGRKGGGLRWGGVRRGPSRSKDALRMTARTNNGEEQATARANAGILRCAQNDNTISSEIWGFFAALRNDKR